MPALINVVRSTFDNRDQGRLAFFSLFQRVIDTEILVFMGIPQFISQDEPHLPWALTELIGMQHDHWNGLARRAHQAGLVGQTDDGLWLIQDQVADGLRMLIPMTTSTESQRLRAFVESTAFSARQHFGRTKNGDSSAHRQIQMNEANYLSAVSLAAASKWPSCILDALLGLQVIYSEPKRINEWLTLLKSVSPIFTDTRTGDALPGMEDMWLVMTSFELGVLLRESKWQQAHPRQAKIVETLERAAMPWLRGLRPLDDEGQEAIERFAGEMSRLELINNALAQPDFSPVVSMSYGRPTSVNATHAVVTRVEMMLKSARELGYQDEQRQKLIEEAIGMAEAALEATDPNDQGLLGKVYFLLGSLQSECERFDEAVRSYQDALFVRKAMGDLLGAGRAEGNIGGVLLATGHRRKALESLSRAETFFEQAGDVGKPDLNYTRTAIDEIKKELSSTESLEPHSHNKGEELNHVIKSMVASIRRGDPREYAVALVGYFIEGYPYSASALAVDSHSTPDIHATEGGFACTSAFPPNMIQPATVKGKQIIKEDVNGVATELVQVNVEVKSDDIYSIAGFWDGKQNDLFSDVETLFSRKARFRREMGLWFDRRKAQ